MSIAGIVSLVVNILFVLILGIGFLIGLKRGVKRAGLRLGLYLVFAIIGAVVSIYITEAVLNIKMTYPNGSRGTILGYFESLLKSNQSISEWIVQNGSLAASLKQIIIVVANLLMFIVVDLIMMFISWIVYLILARFVIKDKKRQKALEEIKKNTTNTFDLTPKPEKKYRILGSLLGAFQALVVVILLFMPISGLVSTVNSVLETKSPETEQTVVVETTSVVGEGAEAPIEEGANELPKTIGDLVYSYIPQEIIDVVTTYRRSAIGAISSIGGLDKACFNSLTTLNVRQKKIKIGEEIENACKIYEKVVKVMEFDFANEKLANLDFEATDDLLNTVFSSNLVTALASDLVPYSITYFVIENDDLNMGVYTGLIKGDGNYSSVGLTSLVDKIRKAENITVEVENNVRALYDIAKIYVKAGIVDDIIAGNVDVMNILDKITQESDNGTILTQTIDKLMSTESLKVAMNIGFNVGLKAIDEKIDAQIGTSKYDATVWDSAKEEINAFATNLSSVYTYYNSLDQEIKDNIASLKFNDQMFESLKKCDLDQLILPLAKALDNINASSVLGQLPDNKKEENLPIIDRVISAVYQSEFFDKVKKFINLEVANNADFKFEDTFASLISVLDTLLERNCLQAIFAEEFDPLLIFDQFDKNKVETPITFDETFGVIINDPMFRPTFVYALNLISSTAKDILGTYVKVDELPYNTNIASQKQDIKTFWDNLLPLKDQILGEGGFKLEDLDFDAVKSLMEGMKVNVYDIVGEVRENAAFESLYLNLIDYMKKDADYGLYFAKYYSEYSNPYDVDWGKLLDAVELAITISNSEQITAKDLNDIVNIASTSPAITEALKDAITDTITDEDLKEKVSNLDLTDKSTLNTVENVAKIAESLSQLGSTMPTVGKDVKLFINNLDAQANQESVDTIIGIVDSIAREEIAQNAQNISAAEISEITSHIDAAQNLSQETKDKIKGMLGIEIPVIPEP